MSASSIRTSTLYPHEILILAILRDCLTGVGFFGEKIYTGQTVMQDNADESRLYNVNLQPSEAHHSTEHTQRVSPWSNTVGDNLSQRVNHGIQNVNALKLAGEGRTSQDMTDVSKHFNLLSLSLN